MVETERKAAKGKPWWRELLEVGALALALSFGVRAAVAEARFIPSGSMRPGLELDDRLVVEKLSLHFRPPQRGDVVVFEPPPAAHLPAGEVLIKRVIGLPGDRVRVAGGRIWVNGQPLPEAYLAEPIAYGPPAWSAIGMPEGRVPPGHVWVLGDNRNLSYDGHAWGPLPVQNLIGRAVFRFWPPTRVGPLTRPSYGASS